MNLATIKASVIKIGFSVLAIYGFIASPNAHSSQQPLLSTQIDNSSYVNQVQQPTPASRLN